MCDLAARRDAMIHIDQIWLAVEPIDMRAGTKTALARVVKAFHALDEPAFRPCSGHSSSL